jgi:carbon monoxide dehydrogenase subunit G
MLIEGEFVVSAPKSEVMKLFSDVLKLAEYLPGCSDVQVLSPIRYRAKMTTQVKFMTLKFDVEGEILQVSDDGHIEAQLTGQPTTLAGVFRTLLTVDVAETESGETRVRYQMNASMTGRLASIGELMMKGSIQKNADEFAQNIIQHFKQATSV